MQPETLKKEGIFIHRLERLLLCDKTHIQAKIKGLICSSKGFLVILGTNLMARRIPMITNFTHSQIVLIASFYTLIALSGYAIYYRDAKTVAEHIWGLGRFAGGDAAVNLARAEIAEISGQGSSSADSHELCLAKEPDDTRGFLLRFWHKLTLKDSSYEGYRNTVRQFYFATDTTFGLKAAWSGTAGPYPDSFKLGYNRKEFASPPIMVNNGCKGNPQHFSIRMPSFFASINNASALANFYDSKTNNVQFFATGKAATEFSKRSDLRSYFSKNIVPSITEKTTPVTPPINPAQ